MKRRIEQFVAAFVSVAVWDHFRWWGLVVVLLIAVAVTVVRARSEP